MRTAVTLLVLLFSIEGAQTRSTQGEVQTESKNTGAAIAAAPEASTQLDVFAEIRKLKDKVFKLDTRVLELGTTLTSTQQQLDNTKILLYRTTAETENLREANDNLTQASAAQQLEITSLKTRLETSEEEMEGLQAKNAALQNDMTAMRSEVRSLTDSNEAQDIELTNMRSKIANLEEENGVLQANIDLVKTETTNLIKVTTAQGTELSVMNIRLTATEVDVENLKGGFAAQHAELTMLKSRLGDTEADVAKIKEQNSALQADLTTLRAEMMNQVETNTAQDVELDGVKIRLGTSEATTEDLKSENRLQNDKLAAVQSGLEATNAEVDKIKTETTTKPKVAFSAGLLESSTGYVEAVDTQRRLIFQKVTTNVGGAYSGITGIFRAPVRGVYYFRFTVKDYLAARYMDISMWRNENQVLWLDGYDTDGHAAYLSTGATLQLEAGDAVNMRMRAGSRLYDNHGEHSTFSGFLLFAL